MSYEAGLYQKGDNASRATTAEEAVNLVFQGYRKVDEDSSESESSPEEQSNDGGAAPASPLDGADPDFNDGSPSEENTSAELAAHQDGSASPSAYTF